MELSTTGGDYFILFFIQVSYFFSYFSYSSFYFSYSFFYLYSSYYFSYSSSFSSEDMIDICGKLAVLHQMLTKLNEDGHKTLIFSQVKALGIPRMIFMMTISQI